MKLVVMVEGSGFKANIDGRTQLIGFFASRVVDAADAAHIDEKLILERLYAELSNSTVTSTSASKMRVAEVRNCELTEPNEMTGFSFFIEE